MRIERLRRWDVTSQDLVLSNLHLHCHNSFFLSPSVVLVVGVDRIADYHTMLSRTFLSPAARRCCRAQLRSFAAAAATAGETASAVKLNFSLPYESLYDGVAVQSVILPGSAGEYGITANHVPYISQLKPGVVQIMHEENSEAEKYFVPGGYALTHADSTTVSKAPLFVMFVVV
jgi:hypothetical protein